MITVTIVLLVLILLILGAFLLGMLVGSGLVLLIIKRHKKKNAGAAIPTPPNMIS